MRIKLVTPDGLTETAKSVFLAECRMNVRAWVATPDRMDGTDWPAVLDILARIAVDAPNGDKYPPEVTTDIKALTEESVATLAAWTGGMAGMLGVSAEQMVAIHYGEGDAVTGTAIGAFMLGRAMLGSEVHVVAHLLRTLDTDQRVSLVRMAVAYLCVLGFMPDDIRKLEYPSTVD